MDYFNTANSSKSTLSKDENQDTVEKGEKSELVSAWISLFKKGTDFDLWGQPVEAIEVYNRLSNYLKQESSQNSTLFSDTQKKILSKIYCCLELRSQVLNDHLNPKEFVSFEDLKTIDAGLKNLLLNNNLKPSLEEDKLNYKINTLYKHSIINNLSKDLNADSEDDTAEVRGNLLPLPPPAPNETYLTMHVQKIGIKDPSQYLDSFMVISVKDMYGVDLMAYQETPLSTGKIGSHIHFGFDVHLQKPLEVLPYGFAVFFEFKHYKSFKKMNSTKCWSILEKDEVQEGSVALEIYKKPLDTRRKKLKLLSSKQLYLHLKLSFN